MDISEPHGVEDNASTDTQGVRGPKAQTLSIGGRVEFINGRRSEAKDVVDIVGGDIMKLAKRILADAEGFVGVGTDKADESLNNTEKVTDETHRDEAGVAGEKASSTVITVFLGFKGQENSADGTFVEQGILQGKTNAVGSFPDNIGEPKGFGDTMDI